jgi:hypothetical protein
MPTILSRLRGLVAPSTPDQPLRLADAGGVTPGTGGGGSPILIARNMRDVRRQTHRGAGGHLNPTGVVAGSYLLSNIQVGADGRIIAASSGSGGGGGSVVNLTPDTHPITAQSVNDEFEFGSSIDTAGARFAGASGWTAFNITGYTTAILAGSILLTNVSAPTSLVGGYTQPISGSTWAYIAKFSPSGGSAGGGIFIATASGASGKISALLMSSGSGFGIIVQHETNATTFSANALTSATYAPVLNGVGAAYPWVYLQISFDGTNLHYSVSANGIAFTTMFSETPAAFIGTPTLIGFTQGGPIGFSTVLDWFRKTL